MKAFKAISSILVVIFMGITLTACAPSSKSEGTGGYIDDTVITTKVKSALLAEKNLKSTQISVETFKGQVQLSGFVSSQADVNKAIETTRKVAGVQSVINSMKIR
ncbi:MULTISPECIES: BON domain-containing protein [Providencia]|uniref:BON domain-containing protein n=1 Tax=Providencia TaxID=586 RepID=UPI001B37F24A|nr:MULTISPECIES: BON domain-containing protein [Providencia]EJD6506171.1 BON domain-containing protein [Providencia rettgeri]MBQ0317535.1 BON domain-containing protein [Providencia rettgeri]MBQ0326041.1 BON domain-containing protein [Providencia rettgeri]MBQ0351491.1 BON domain-containing protein [Providencia rettgeri]MBQ0405959.1 BON domain-containing protein [Providencia rettgeri]